MKIHLFDTDIRQYTDPNYLTNYGSFSIVARSLNEGLKEIGYYSEPNDAEFVGISDGLNLNFFLKGKKSFIVHVFDCINVLPNELLYLQKKTGIKIVGLSKQVSDLWRKFGVEADFINIGTDTNYYQQICAKNNDELIFLFDSYSNVRSGIELAIQAFDSAFNSGDKKYNVQLIIKNTSDSEQLQKKIVEYQNKGNNIIYINRRIDFAGMRQLYSLSNVLLSVFHHSSWGLSVHQAAACNCLPVVGNFCPSHTMAVDVMLNPNKTVKIEDKLPELINEWGLHSAYPMHYTYSEPMLYYDYEISDYAELLKDIYNNWQNKYSLIDTRTKIVDNWSNRKAAEKLVNILKNV